MENGPEENGPEIEYDPAKDVRNIEKHGVSLAEGRSLFADPYRVFLEAKFGTGGEERLKIVGKLYDRVYTGIFTWRGEAARFMSIRRSQDDEERRYRHQGGSE